MRTALQATLARYDAAGQRMVWTALLGAVAMGVMTVINLATQRLPALEMFMALTMLVIGPLVVALSTHPRSEGPQSVYLIGASWLVPPAAVVGTISLFLPTSGFAALLAVPWALAMMLVGAEAVVRFARYGFASLEELGFALGLLYLPLGAFWYVAARLGIRPLGVPEIVVLLAAVHFSNAGSTALFLAGTSARWLARRRMDRMRNLLVLSVMGGLMGPTLTAFGIAYAWEVVEKTGAVAMELGYVVLAGVTLGWLAPRMENRATRTLLYISGSALLVGLIFAALYTLRVLNIPQMIHSHGYIMGVVVCVTGLVGWAIHGPVAARKPSTDTGFEQLSAELAAFTFLPFIGQMLLSMTLVAFWKSQPPAEFTAWFSANLPKMTAVLVPLGAMAGLASLMALFFGRNTPSRRGWLAVSALCWILIACANPLFFDQANKALATPGALSASEIASTLEAWGRWHALRLGIGLVGVICAVRALGAAGTRREGFFAEATTLMFGLLGGTLVLTAVLSSIWRAQPPGEFTAWFSANAERTGQLLVPLAGLTGLCAVLAFIGARHRMLLGGALACFVAIFLENPLFFAKANTALATPGALTDAQIADMLATWSWFHMARLALAFMGLGMAMFSLRASPFPVLDPSVPDSEPIPDSLSSPPAEPLAVPAEFTTFDELVAGLTRLEELLTARRDRRGVFATTYLTMIREMQQWVDRGQFTDRAWITRYSIALGNLFRRALEAYERRELGKVAPCWRIAFEAAQRPGGLVTQDVLLALNAHVNHDHVLGLLEVGIDQHRPQRHRDYLAVNPVLDACTSAVRQRIAERYAPGLGLLDKLMGPVDELFSRFSMERARDTAWEWAMRITDAPGAPGAEIRREMVEKARRAAEWLAAPTQDSSWLARMLARLEDSSAAELPPGRLGLPWLGQTLAFAKDPVHTLYEGFKKHGPVFKLRLLGNNTIAYVGPEAFSQLSGPGAERYVRRENANPPAWRELMGGETSPHTDGPERLRRKRLLLSAFQPEALAGYVPLVEQILRAYLARWEQQGRFAWLPELRSYSFAVCDALYTGAPAEPRKPEDARGMDALYAGFFSMPIPLPFTPFWRALNAKDALVERIQQSAARHRASPGTDVMSWLVKSGLTDEEIGREVVQFYFGSYAALFTTFSCIVIALAQKPEVMRRAREEVRAHAPSGPLSLEKLNQLPYLHQLTREVRRFYPLTPNTLFATAIRDFDLQGYHVPRGWKVIGCVHAALHDPAIFADPERFDPDRFAPAALARLPANAAVAHGAGPADGHRCTGETLADLHLALFTAVLLQDYTWELPPQDLTLAPSGIPAPRGGLQVILRRVPTTS